MMMRWVFTKDMLITRTGSRLAVLCCTKQRSFIDLTHRCDSSLDNHMNLSMRGALLMWPSCGSPCTGCRGKHTRCAVTTSLALAAVRHKVRVSTRCSNTITSGRLLKYQQGSMVLRDACRVGRIERMHSILREVRPSAVGQEGNGHTDQVEPVGDSLEIKILHTYNSIQ